MFWPRNVPVLSDVVLIFFSSAVVTTPHDNFLVVPVLHSVSDVFYPRVRNLNYAACKAHAPYYIVKCGFRLYQIFPNYLIKVKIFGEKNYLT
jgi:hypothetical protein